MDSPSTPSPRASARGGRFYLLAFLLKNYGARVASFIERRMALVVAGLFLQSAITILRDARADLARAR